MNRIEHNSSAVLHARGDIHRGSTVALSGADIVLQPGEVTAIVGKNGAGKTTLLSGLAGLLPFDGQLTISGRDMQHRRAHHRARAGLALVPQGRQLVPAMTVADNLRAAALSPLGPGPHVNVDDLFPAIRTLSQRPAGWLSGGQQQQVAIARALLRRPSLLLLDEPTEGLSPNLIDEVTDVLRVLLNKGIALLIAEQRLDVVEQLCDSTIVLRAGEVAAAGATTDPTVREHALHI